MNSINYYSHLSENYREISKSKASYLKSIDLLVIDTVRELGMSNMNYLDIGTGDGFRAIHIATEINAKTLTGIDNCADMLGKTHFSMNFIQVDITKDSINPQSHVATSLWNVFGHLGGKKSRFLAFQNVNRSLSENGLFFLDVNNRYNIRHYGLKSVIVNLLQTVFRYGNRGFFVLNVGNETTKVYIHTPSEIDRIASRTGFELIKKLYVDYNTGEVVSTKFCGQIFYCLRKIKSV